MDDMEQQAIKPKPRGGAPLGNRFALVHGHYSQGAIAERKRARAAVLAARAARAAQRDQKGPSA